MKHIIAGIILLAFATSAFALTTEERTAEDQKWVNLMEKVEVCTTDKEVEFSEAERLRRCLQVEQWLRNGGSCMYSPGVLGIWDGKHCR